MKYTVLALVVLAAGVAPPPVGGQQGKVARAAGFDIEVIGDLREFTLQGDVTKIADGLETLTLTLKSPQPRTPPRFSLKWSIPSHDVAGHWMTGRGQTKTIRPDWSGVPRVAGLDMILY